MTGKDAYDIAVRYTELNARNFYVFILISLVFGGWTVLSPDINETDPYVNMRKVMAIGYSLAAVCLLMLTLKFMVRSNAALRLAGQLFESEQGPELAKSGSAFHPTSWIWAVFAMVAIIIAVNYIILIYAVDGGLF